MRKITTLICLAWAITQLQTSELEALKGGDIVTVKEHTLEVWAMPNKDVLIVKGGQDD